MNTSIENTHDFILENKHDEHWIQTMDINGNLSMNSISMMSINLHAGANLISLNIDSEDNTIQNMLSSLNDNIISIDNETRLLFVWHQVLLCDSYIEDDCYDN